MLAAAALIPWRGPGYPVACGRERPHQLGTNTFHRQDETQVTRTDDDTLARDFVASATLLGNGVVPQQASLALRLLLSS